MLVSAQTSLITHFCAEYDKCKLFRSCPFIAKVLNIYKALNVVGL